MSDSTSSSRPRGTVLTGSLVALVGALAFAPITTLARLAYDAGADGASLVLCRYLLAVLVLWAMLLLRGRLPLLPRGAWGKSLAAGVCWIGGTYGYLGAVEYIPVSLAAVAIYAYPLVVAALSPFVEKTRLTLLHGLAFLTAFGGLALALGPDLSSLDWRGLALAGTGIVGSAGMLLLTARQAPEVDSMTHTFWVNLVGLAGVSLLVNFTGGLQLPGTDEGWLAFVAALSIYIVAILAVLGGAKLAGAARTAMIMNLEPIITLALATLVLGEILGWEQLVGAGLVLGAVMGITWLDLIIRNLGDSIDHWTFLPPLLVAGLGLGMGFSGLFQSVLSGVPPRDAGAGSGALQAFQQIGGAIGVALVGEIFFSGLAASFATGAAPKAAFAAAAGPAITYQIVSFAAVVILVPFLKIRPPGGGQGRAPASAPVVAEA